jgi:hypothetical protein
MRVLMKQFSKIFLLLVFFTSFVTWAQVAGDYRSAATGDWDAVATWQTYDGSNWVAAVAKPGASNSVYVQYSHVVTLTGNEACNDLHCAVVDGLGGLLAGIVKLQSYTLELNGKLRCYIGVAGTIPGANGSASLTWGSTKWPIQAASSTSGLLKIVGNSRALTSTGEWGAGTGTAASYSPSVEVALNSGQTVTLGTNIKFSNWTFTSGIFNAQTGTVSADNGTLAAGNITIGTNATFMSATTSTQCAFQRTGSTPMGTFSLNGLLVLTGTAPLINATVVNLSGTVQYDAAGAQTFLKPGTGGVAITSYTNVIASNSGVKTTPGTSSVIWVAGARTETGTATFALGTGDSWGVYYKSKSAGDLTDVNTWGDQPDGTGTNPVNFTSANQAFLIKNRTSTTLSSSWTVSGTGAKVIVGDGINSTTLTIGTGGSLNGTVDVSSSSILELTNNSFPSFGANYGEIQFNNPSGFTLASDLVLPAGNVTLVSGNINVSTYTLTVNGVLICGTNNIVGSGTFTLSAGASLRIGSPDGISSSGATGNIQTSTRNFNVGANYVYNGTGTSLITGNGLPSSVNAITINLTNATDIITLTNPVTTTGSIYSFQRGRLKLGNNDISTSATTGGSGSSDGYVITNGTGRIIRPQTNTSTTAKTFHVGTETEYRKVVITFPTTTGVATTNLNVKYVSGNAGSVGYPTGIVNHSPRGYWVITMDLAPINSYTIDVETAGIPGLNNISTARILKRTNNTFAWDFAGTAHTNTGTVKTETGCVGLSEFVIGGGVDNPLSATALNITALIEGFYDGSSMVSDTVTVALHNGTSPWALVDQAKTVLNTSGSGTANFYSAVDATNYYIAVKHRNAVETWSANPQPFTGGTLIYDFTTASNKAYSDGVNTNLPMKQISSKWCFWSGDVTHNYFIEYDDLLQVYNKYLLSLEDPGYWDEDVTGNEFVEFDDVLLVYNNYTLAIWSQNPLNPVLAARPIKAKEISNKVNKQE